MQWHYSIRGEKFGPVDESELFRLAQQGRIAPDDLVWNPTMDDKWDRASSVQNLFTSPVSVAPPPVVKHTPQAATENGTGTTHNRDLMRMAKESLSNHWGIGVGVMLLYYVIFSGASGIPFFGLIASLIIAGPMAVGLCFVFLSLSRRENANVGQLFEGFNRFGTPLAACLLMNIFIFLWSLLLIIPGIIAGYAYSMTFFIIADDPTVTPFDAISRSKKMMQGKKWKLFCLQWRFFGWVLLCILTLGIGYLWLGPYIQTAIAHFYNDVRRET